VTPPRRRSEARQGATPPRRGCRPTQQVTPPRRPSRSWVASGGAGRGFWSLRGGVTCCVRPLSSFALAACVLMVAASGCGEPGGVASGATVRVYVVAPLCGGAEGELARHGREAGELRVRAICLPSGESSQKLDLAQIGANARRATEDSSSIAYIGERTRAASRFSAPILREAGIAQLPATSGAAGMEKVLRVLEDAGDVSSPRQSVFDQLD